MDDSLVSESQLPEAAETNDTDLSIAQPAEENDANDNANPADTSLALDSPRLDQTEQQPIQQEQEQPLPTTDEKQQEHFLTEEEDDKMMNELAEESMEEQDELEENRLHLLQLYKEALDDREKLHSQYARQQMRVYPIIKKQSSGDKQQQERQGITDIEERYAKYVQEHRNLRVELADMKKKSTAQTEEMRSRLDERHGNAQELQMSLRNFKKTMMAASVHSNTGKQITKTDIADFVKEDDEKDTQIRQYRTKYLALKDQKETLDLSIKEKEEFSKGLHLIDFEQLKMENASLNEKIEEKNESLQKNRIKSTQTVHILTHVKEKLQFVQSENADMQRKLGEMEKELAQHKDTLTQIKREKEVVKTDNTQMKDGMPLAGSDNLLLDYETRKKELVVNKTKLQTLRERHSKLAEEANYLDQTMKKSLMGSTSNSSRFPPILHKIK